LEAGLQVARADLLPGPDERRDAHAGLVVEDEERALQPARLDDLTGLQRFQERRGSRHERLLSAGGHAAVAAFHDLDAQQTVLQRLRRQERAGERIARAAVVRRYS